MGGAEGGLVLYYQKSFVISILGFSKVEISKMISIFILGYPQPLQGRPRGGLGGSRGGFSPIIPKTICYINSGVFNSGEFKNNLYSHFRVTLTLARAPTGGLGGPEGGLVLHYQKSCVISILRFSIVGISKMISIFTLGYPKPPQGRPQEGGLEGPKGGLVLYYP